MGLDMFFMRTKEKIADVDFDVPQDSDEIFYFRKHPDLHDEMERLYRSKGGTSLPAFGSFQSTVAISLSDIEILEQMNREDFKTSEGGFFFGESQLDQYDRHERLWLELRRHINNEFNVFYWSWW